MKKLSKKLKLNKETITMLNNEQMSNLKGGRGSNGTCDRDGDCVGGIPQTVAPSCEK